MGFRCNVGIHLSGCSCVTRRGGLVPPLRTEFNPPDSSGCGYQDPASAGSLVYGPLKKASCTTLRSRKSSAYHEVRLRFSRPPARRISSFLSGPRGVGADFATELIKNAIGRFAPLLAKVLCFLPSMSRTQAISWLKAVAMIGIYGGLLMPLVFVPKVIFPFVFSKLIFFQILIGLTFPAYVVLAWMEPRLRPRRVPLVIAITAYFIALGISVIFSVDPIRAWWGNQERMNGLFTLLHFFAWFVMTTSLLTTWKQWRRILLFQVVLSVFMAVVTLLEFPFPRLLMFPAGDRPGGLLDNPIYMAAYQIFNLFFIALLWMKGASRSLKLWLVAFAMADIGAFLAAQSRGALVGLGAGVVVFALVYAFFTSNRKAKTVVLGGAAALFIAYGILFAFRHTDFVSHSILARLTNLTTTVDTRLIAWKIAWQGFLERPLTGWGLDDFHILFNLKYNPQSLRFSYYETWFDRSHNTVMDALSMTGIFGFLTFFGIFGALFYSAVRAYRKGWIDLPILSIFFGLPVAYFVQNLFVFDQPAGFTMSFFLYALVASATAAEFVGAKDETAQADVKVLTTGKPIPWIAFGVLQIAAIVVVWRFSYLPVLASVYSIKSNTYFSAQQYQPALQYARRAAEIPTPYLEEQTFLQGRNLIGAVDDGSIQKIPDWKAWHDLVKDLTERYLKEHPDNTNPLFVYARFLQSFAPLVPEDVPLIEKEYQEAIRTSPKRQQLYYSYAQYVLQKGDKQKALDLFKQAEDFDPGVGESHWYVGLTTVFDFGKLEEGATEMRAAMTAQAPYQLRDVREAVALSDAYVILHDADGLKDLITNKLGSLPNGTATFFFQIARDAEKLGLIEQRNLILGALAQQDPSIAARLVPLEQGAATSIDQSLLMTQPTTTAKTPVKAPTTTTTTSSSSVGSGPRAK